MRFTTTMAALATAWVAACSGPGGSDGGAECVPLTGTVVDAGSPEPTDVPFDLVPVELPVSDGGTIPVGVRFAIQLGIGAAGTIPAWLDTGSAGIQILQQSVSSAVLDDLQTLGSETLTEEFEGGLEATGVVAMASITLGDRVTPVPIPILLIQSVSCAPGFPCQDESAPLESTIFNGFPAIVGIGMRSLATTPALGNPIAQLPGQPDFIVKAPSFGGDAGTLRIGPTAAEVADYQLLQLEPLGPSSPTGDLRLSNCTPVWNDAAVPVCVDDQTGKTDYCADGLLDTGSVLTFIEWQGYSGPDSFASGTSVQVSVGPSGSPTAQFDVTVSASPQAGLDLFGILPSTVGENLINLGTTLFFRYDVYFDQASGQIGLLAH
jgi:hypothetical protein